MHKFMHTERLRRPGLWSEWSAHWHQLASWGGSSSSFLHLFPGCCHHLILHLPGLAGHSMGWATPPETAPSRLCSAGPLLHGTAPCPSPAFMGRPRCLGPCSFCQIHLQYLALADSTSHGLGSEIEVGAIMRRGVNGRAEWMRFVEEEYVGVEEEEVGGETSLGRWRWLRGEGIGKDVGKIKTLTRKVGGSCSSCGKEVMATCFCLPLWRHNPTYFPWNLSLYFGLALKNV